MSIDYGLINLKTIAKGLTSWNVDWNEHEAYVIYFIYFVQLSGNLRRDLQLFLLHRVKSKRFEITSSINEQAAYIDEWNN